MYLINCLPVAGIRTVSKALGLTAICVVSFVATIYVAPIIIAAITAALLAIAAFIAAVVAAVAYVAVYAATMALWCGTACAVAVALSKVLPWMWAHRHGLLLAAKGICFAGIVVGVFVGAIVVMPLVFAVAGKIIVTGGVLVAAVMSGKVM